MQLTQICLVAAKGLALILMFTLVACIDLKQSIEISDGFASYQMETRMNAALAQLDAENLGKFCESNDDLQVEVSGSLKKTIKQSYEGEDIVCRMEDCGPYPRVWRTDERDAERRSHEDAEFPNDG